MCWGQFARQAFARLTADEHGQIVSVTEIMRLQGAEIANVTTKNDGLMHKSVATCAVIEFHLTVVPSPDEESTFHAEDVEDTEVEYNSFHRAFT